ncbi:quinone-dependent dihydroorotate dehydrogenase [Dickeya fangzhongdai]|uniref:quinone-dependent dihydroorotate dehydrogenase n=1 Tax=Dickeya fangzhongdai TaxID=1778540 RepID=UPI0026E028CD|nr:quinone-dependent dihydroorotate dehydrogenase [Dickeya fangzhongdai]WKV49756.1 quinone-dependent dihydroorotate dehydrogenase [Dickeya fangzhongdai]
MTEHLHRLITHVLRRLPPEFAHRCAINGLRYAPRIRAGTLSAELTAGMSQPLLGRHFSHPIGLAAGFDKDAQAVNALAALGFSFVEAGAVTPLPQPGNPKPRLFRFPKQQSLINQYGFNSRGLDYVAANLAQVRRDTQVGINIGKNKHSDDPLQDYATCASRLMEQVDFITLNFSSPNTPGLRNLVDEKHLRPVLATVQSLRQASSAPARILFKLSPDMEHSAVHDLIELLIEHQVDGIIVSNTTTQRESIDHPQARSLGGGLSGLALKKLSEQMLERVYPLAKNRLAIIASGGLFTGQDIYDRIIRGADLVQILTSFVYHGPGIIYTMLRQLREIMDQQGIRHLSSIKGSYYE